MKTALIIAAGALAWYVIGLLSVGIGNIFDKATDYKNWIDNRDFLYKISALGPFLTLILVGMLLKIMLKVIWKIFKMTGILLFSIRITDWILAGFRKPPVKPREENEKFFAPTVSP